MNSREREVDAPLMKHLLVFENGFYFEPLIHIEYTERKHGLRIAMEYALEVRRTVSQYKKSEYSYPPMLLTSGL